MGTLWHHGERTPTQIGLDTYAEMDFISVDLARQLGLKPCTHKKHNHHVPLLEAAGGASLTSYGIYHIHLEIKDRWNRPAQLIRPFVAINRSPTDAPILFGQPTLKDMRIIIHNDSGTWEYEQRVQVAVITQRGMEKELTHPHARVYAIRMAEVTPQLTTRQPDDVDQYEEQESTEAPPDPNDIPACIRKFLQVFDTRKCSILTSRNEAEHAIELLPGTSPPWQKLILMSPAELKALEEWLNMARKKNWIRESQADAGANILFVPKKDGSLQLCVDYRGLNNITVKNRYPLPLISELLDRLHGTTVFSKIDLKDAYYRICIKEGDQWKTAFRTRHGHFEWVVMPMGLTNAPATFQAYINRALRGLVDDFCIVYLDDILIFSKSEAEHEKHLQLVLDRLERYELYAKASKCAFFQKGARVFGFYC